MVAFSDALVHFHQVKPNVLTLHVISEYTGGSMFHPPSQIDAKTLSDCVLNSPNFPEKWSHECVFGRLWAIAAPILHRAFSCLNQYLSYLTPFHFRVIQNNIMDFIHHFWCSDLIWTTWTWYGFCARTTTMKFSKPRQNQQ